MYVCICNVVVSKRHNYIDVQSSCGAEADSGRCTYSNDRCDGC